MSVWWILAAVIGGLIGAGMGILAEGLTRKRRAGEGAGPYRKPEINPAETVTVRARRDIPLDVWYDRVSKSDAKAAAAQLQVSMAQQIATEAAQYVRVTYCYDPVKKAYEISARMRVVPWRSWE